MIVYGADGKTPIDPRSLPADAQEDLRKFARFASRSFLFKEGPPRAAVAPEWATPLRTAPSVAAATSPAQQRSQGDLFA